MSMVALRWVRGIRVTPTQKLVLYCLADLANDHGECWPSVAMLVEATCLSERAIRAAMREIERLGLVSSQVHRGRPSTYLLHVRVGAAGAPKGGQEMPEGREMPPAGNAPQGGTKCPPPETYGGQELPPVGAADAGVGAAGAPGSLIEASKEAIPPTPSPPPPADGRRARPARKSNGSEPSEPKWFAEFWARYPRKVAKGDAARAWNRAIRIDAAADIVQCLQVQIDLEKFDLREGCRFVPYPATWLNGRRWLDGLDEGGDDDAPPDPPPRPAPRAPLLPFPADTEEPTA